MVWCGLDRLSEVQWVVGRDRDWGFGEVVVGCVMNVRFFLGRGRDGIYLGEIDGLELRRGEWMGRSKW